MFVETKLNCGSCAFFDTFYVDKQPIGTMRLEGGGEIARGLCRTNCGLMFGVRDERMPCRQPKGVYKSIL